MCDFLFFMIIGKEGNKSVFLMNKLKTQLLLKPIEKEILINSLKQLFSAFQHACRKHTYNRDPHLSKTLLKIAWKQGPCYLL